MRIRGKTQRMMIRNSTNKEMVVVERLIYLAMTLELEYEGVEALIKEKKAPLDLIE